MSPIHASNQVYTTVADFFLSNVVKLDWYFLRERAEHHSSKAFANDKRYSNMHDLDAVIFLSSLVQ